MFQCVAEVTVFKDSIGFLQEPIDASHHPAFYPGAE